MNGLWIQLLLSLVIWAEEQYFFQPNNTWDEARFHCQECFKELTTVTSRNVHLIVQNLSSDHWVGLRQRVSNDSIPWSAWSNGDPVTYQNWYPGHPVPNKVKKLIPICFSTTQPPTSTLKTTTSSQLTSSTSTVTLTPTSSKTSTVNSSPVSPSEMSSVFDSNKTDDVCLILIDALNCLNMTYEDLEIVVKNKTKAVTPTPATYSTSPTVTTYSTTPNATTFSSTFNTTTESTTTNNCIFEPEPDLEVYIEDACLALLSFGMWKEDKCNKSLPYICYEERFFGEIYISNVTTSAGSLNWTEGPGNISHYRVELSGDIKQTFNESGLSAQIQNLSAGTLYNIQVIPVKCGRDLNPQNISFYTRPSGVENLTVVNVTTNSAYLKWNKPFTNANCDSYLVLSVTVDGQHIRTQIRTKIEECNITDLIPGSEYVFTVTATVNQTITGVPSNISEYTMPSKVNLTSKNSTTTTIKASWEEPKGNHSGYFYCVKNAIKDSKCSDCNITNCTTIDCTTTDCNTTDCNITKCNIITTESIEVTGLIPGSRYLLCVSALTKNNNISGEMAETSAYTKPNTVSLTLEPNSQEMIANWEICGRYDKFNVLIENNSTTDGYSRVVNTSDKTSTFSGLKAAVKYTVTIVTFSGDGQSDPATLSKYTIPTVPDSVIATVRGANSICLSWQPPKDSGGAILYIVNYNTSFWGVSLKVNTTNTTFTFEGLKSGTMYDFDVCVGAGDLTSKSVRASAQTVSKKKSLSLAMLCSSQESLLCGKNTTKQDLITKLENKIGDNLNGVHWKLSWVDGK